MVKLIGRMRRTIKIKPNPGEMIMNRSIKGNKIALLKFNMFTSGDKMALLYYTIRTIKILKRNIIEIDVVTIR